jgi:molybdate transport system substrate-binding protein
MTTVRLYALAIVAGLMSSFACAQQMTLAAASSLRPTLDYVVEAYRETHPRHQVSIIYGASGRLTAQILNGAPFDFFMSADMDYPRRLADEAAAASEPRVYAKGRLVLWSANFDAAGLTLENLTDDNIRRVAIAQPNIAPYGQRAREAMQAVGVWGEVESKLVFGENISQVAQMAQSGAADVGLIALSLVLQPALYELTALHEPRALSGLTALHGPRALHELTALHEPRALDGSQTLSGPQTARGYYLIDAALHEPLQQGYVITRRGADNEVAEAFSRFLATPTAQAIFRENGFDVDD